jgi:hypothetical protein
MSCLAFAAVRRGVCVCVCVAVVVLLCEARKAASLRLAKTTVEVVKGIRVLARVCACTSVCSLCDCETKCESESESE